jgi:hypothetical protein
LGGDGWISAPVERFGCRRPLNCVGEAVPCGGVGDVRHEIGSVA